MGKVYLCKVKMAKSPYLMKNNTLNIYSIEELCYYICNNVYIIDESLMDMDLCKWIRDELGMEYLADELVQQIKAGGNFATFIKKILSSTGYCENNEIEETVNILAKLMTLSDFARKRMKSDNMMKKGKLYKAIPEYYKNIVSNANKNISPQEMGDAWHNMGVGFAKLFLYKEASYCFKKGFELNNREETHEEFMLAQKLLDNEEEVLREYGNDLNDINECDCDELLNNWRREYNGFV